jgi:glutamyl-Q tRNA(Asp) synthetase
MSESTANHPETPSLTAVPSRYCGRFAPSPTGALHIGSVIAALGSYLEAKTRHGLWRVRMEDIDPPREIPGAADDILRTLEACHLFWDGPVLYQSTRSEAYAAALEQLKRNGHTYECACSRKDIALATEQHAGLEVYPGTCRNGPSSARVPRALRIRVSNEPLRFTDALQGEYVQQLEQAVGDFVIRRTDGLFAYQLAVVVDDAWQGITDVVRGADLLDNTPRQIHLQRLLKLPTPHYLHLPVATNAQHEKLSKQTHAGAVTTDQAGSALCKALHFLGQTPPQALERESPAAIMAWALQNWSIEAIPRRFSLPLEASV